MATKLVQPVAEDETSVFDWVKSSLGAPNVDLEITNSQLKNFLRQSMDKYSRNIPKVEYFSVAGKPGIQQYFLDRSTLGYGIVTVMIPRLDPIAPLLLSSGPRLDIFGYRYSYPYRDISELMIDYYYFSEATRVLSSNFDWEYFDNSLHISPAPDEAFTLTYASAFPRDISTIPSADLDWVREHVMAQTMRAMGFARRKFQVPGAESAQRLDGAELVAEGNRMLEQLEQDLYLRIPPFPILRNEIGA